MKKKISYFNYEERNGLYLLTFLVMLFSTFIFLQKRILPSESTITILHQSSHSSTPEDLQISPMKSINGDIKPMRSEEISTLKVRSFPSKEIENDEELRMIRIEHEETTGAEKKTLVKDLRKSGLALYDKGEKYIKKNFKKKSVDPISINTTDPEKWQEIYGIGPVFSERIVKYQKWLGGFHSPEQLMEVYGITDTIFQKIEPFLLPSTPYALIDINKAEVEQLGKHPYISWKEAKLIVKYRKHHGNFKSSSDLNNVKALTEEMIGRISPYLTFGDDHVKT